MVLSLWSSNLIKCFWVSVVLEKQCVAHVIYKTSRPVMIIVPNKTIAGQIWQGGLGDAFLVEVDGSCMIAVGWIFGLQLFRTSSWFCH